MTGSVIWGWVSSNGDLVFVGTYGPDLITVVNASTAVVVAKIPVGGYPITATQDPVNGDLFVVCGFWGWTRVDVINLTTDLVTRQFTAGGAPSSILRDSANGNLYLANSGTDNVTVVNGTTEGITANIRLGHGPYDMALDPARSSLFVLDQNGPLNLTVVNTTTDAVRSRIALNVSWNNTTSGSLAVDPARGRLYVALAVLNVLTVVSTTNDTIVQNITLPTAGPSEVALDPPAGAVVVSYVGSGAFTFLSAANDSILGTLRTNDGGSGFSVDPATGDLTFVNSLTDQVDIVSATARWFLANVSVGLRPAGTLYDPFNRDLYVSELDLGGVTILNASTNALVGSVLTGPGAAQMALCPTFDRVFVANGGTNTVSVLNATTNALVTTSRVLYYPGGMACDPADGDVFVTTGGGVSVLNGTTGVPVATVVGFSTPPTRVVFDPANREVYAMDGCCGPVSVLNGTTFQFAANVSLGPGYPVDIAYVPATADVWALTSYPGTLAAISGGNNTVYRQLNLSAPGVWGMAVEPASATVVVTLQGDSFNGIEEVVNVSSLTREGSVGVGTAPSSIIFLPRQDIALVSDEESASVSVLSLSTPQLVATVRTGANPTNFAYAPGTQTVYCVNTGTGTLTVLGPSVPYPVTFYAAGLPAGRNWSVAWDGVNSTSANSTLTIGAPNGTHAFSVSSPLGFSPLPAAGNLTVNGAGASVIVVFRPSYFVTFNASGLPTGAPWAVTLNGSTRQSFAGSISFPEVNGSYNFSVSNVPGWRSDRYAGSVRISGTGASVRLDWSRTMYMVNFTSSGLPVGRTWGVIVNTSTYRSSTQMLEVPLPNGTYNYSIAGAPGYAPVRASGSLTVAASDLATSVNFTAGFPVEFSETGLPNGTTWEVALNGSTNLSSTSTIVFEVPHGTFEYALSNIPGWRAGAYSGSVPILGMAAWVNITWTQTVYYVPFTESGLPYGTLWSVSIGGRTYTSTQPIQVTGEPNGSFDYSVANVPGWRANQYGGSVGIQGRPVTVAVSWSQNLFSVTILETGLPTGKEWSARWNGGILVFSTSDTIQFHAANGTGSFSIGGVQGWRPNQYSGKLAVDDGPSGTTISWTAFTYAVTVDEVGLPAGTSWAVTSSGVTNRSIGPVLGFVASNGSFEFNVSNVPGWRANSYSRALIVYWGTANATVWWVRTTYSLNVSAGGLPRGTNWTATVNGTSSISVNSSLSVTGLPNGTYSFSVSSPGYVASDAPPSVTIGGSSVSLALAWAPARPHFAWPSLLDIALGGSVVVGGILVAGLILNGRREPSRTRRSGRAP